MRLLITTFLTFIAYNVDAIPDGHLAYTGLYPYAAVIIDQGKIVCGSTILSAQFVVTAAHCFKRGRDVNNIDIIAGVYNLNKTTAEDRRPAHVIIIHPRYSLFTKDFDIALVHFMEPFQLERPNLQRINLAPGCYDEYYGDDAETFGWGTGKEDSTDPPTRLTYINTKLWYQEQCESRNIWGPDAHYIFGPLISERMLCASIPRGGPGSCDSDDGSGLVTYKRELLGVLSWRYDCHSVGKPSVYISIPLMRSWIIRVMANFEQ